MSGSITSYTVALSPEELARIELERQARERTRVARERVLAAASLASAATVAVASAVAPAASSAGTRASTTRLQAGVGSGVAGRGQGRATTTRVVTNGGQASRAAEPDSPSQPSGRPPSSGPHDDAATRAFRLELVEEARRRGLAEIAAAADAAPDAAAVVAVEAALDDAIDAAATARLVERRLDEAVRAVLGEDWTPQPNEVGRTRRSAAGDTLRSHVEAAADGSAVVELVIDARSAEINGRASGTCGQENRITRELLTEAATGELRLVTPPAVVRRESTHLGGLARGRSSAADADARGREDPRR